jgi:hypothetical protein
MVTRIIAVGEETGDRLRLDGDAHEDSGILRVGGRRHREGADLDHRAADDRGRGWHCRGIIIVMYLPMFRIFELIE